MVHIASDLRSMVQIAHMQNCSIVSKNKKLSLEPISYFGHNKRKLHRIGMKLTGFVCREEVYKTARVGPFPILLRFGENCKKVVFKDMGPYHRHESRLS
jgi:hypothetical protein